VGSVPETPGGRKQTSAVKEAQVLFKGREKVTGAGRAKGSLLGRTGPGSGGSLEAARSIPKGSNVLFKRDLTKK